VKKQGRGDNIDFKAGDIVQLKSGGSEMTIEEIINRDNGENTVKCRWFVNGEVRDGKFNPVSLRPVRENS
jgi:uncharacterized protein YodC (DUF2158 family)